MDKKPDDKGAQDVATANETETKIINTKNDTITDMLHPNIIPEKHDIVGLDKKEDDEEDEEEEEEEEDRIIEKSPGFRFHKRNKKYMKKVPGIDNSFIAIEPKSGKEVIWNEIQLSDKRCEQENRFINLIKKLKRYNHPFFVRFLDVWLTKGEGTARKIIFVTERLTDPTMKQYFVNSSSSQRLTNKSLWRKFVGQLLSVLKFLNHLGVYHGNLSNETVYYQNTGCLKVGTLAVDLNFDNKSTNDIYDVGNLALEMAAYEASDDAENLNVKDRIQKMLSRITDAAQCSFIQTCIDNSDSSTSLSKLFQHIVLKEVPSLKRLAAKIIVQNFLSTTEEGKDEKVETQHSIFSTIIKDQTSHFEDETVLFMVVFEHENITKKRLWKEFRVNFTNLPKYLDDVKNGFYPIFEAKTGQLGEDAEDVTYSYSVDQDMSKDAVVGANGVVNTMSKESNLSQILENIEYSKESIIFDPLVKDTNVELKDEMESKPKNDTTVTAPTHHESKNVGSAIFDKVGVVSTPKDPTVIVEVNNESPATESHKNNLEEIKTEGTPEPVVIMPPEVAADSVVGFEDNNENETNEEEDDEEYEDSNAGGTERVEPYWNYVSPPEKPPSDRALFTGCVYSYIGCGRWQIYVQIWFLEDRLKREVIIQVMEHDWNNDSRIAAMFENGKIISSADKPVLERILGYARHNCSLVDGELIPPQQMLSNFDVYDLYQRLEHLQMFDKARQLLEKAEYEHSHHGKLSQSPNIVSSGVSSAPSAHHPTQGVSSITTPGEKPQAQLASEDQAVKTPKVSPLSESTNVDDKATIMKSFKIGELPGFKMELMDIRILAPLNYSCMFCDNHDYMHNDDLPPYLSSPCYHCREGLAKESKISPSTLFDLHQQNLVPWPAFLQVRFNIPPVADPCCGNMSIKELIDYDCKWRGRSPCRCFVDMVLPPCVEFPNMYSDVASDTNGHVTYTINEHSTEPHTKLSVNVDPGHVTQTALNNESPYIDITNAKTPNLSGNLKTSAVYPCSNRHLKGATITCVHSITFPRLAYPSAMHSYYKKIIK